MRLIPEKDDGLILEQPSTPPIAHFRKPGFTA